MTTKNSRRRTYALASLFFAFLLALAACGSDEEGMQEGMHSESQEGMHEDMAAAHGVPEEFAEMENPIPATEESIARGQELYQTHCAMCHGETGQGDGAAAAGLEPKPAKLSDAHVQGNTDGSFFYIISKGVEGTAMVGWENQITEEDRWNLVNFVRAIEPADTEQ